MEQIKQVAITIDDGPSGNTENILKGLKDLKANVTFFLIGNQVNGRESVIHQMYSDGHEIGCHTYSHPQGTIREMEEDSVRKEILLCVNEIKSAVPNVVIKSFRGPGGAATPAIRTVAKEYDFRMYGWSQSIDTYQFGNKQQIIKDFMAANIVDGDIILIHDHNAFMAELIVELAKQLKENGYEMITANELLQRKQGGIAAEIYRDPII